MEMFVVDMPVVEPTLDFGPRVNLTNLHSGVWAVLHTMSDDEEVDEEVRDILAKARDALDDLVSPKILYNIMKDEAEDYVLDPYNMLVYANEIITANEKRGKLINAQ